MGDPGQPGSRKPNQTTKIKDKQEESWISNLVSSQLAQINQEAVLISPSLTRLPALFTCTPHNPAFLWLPRKAVANPRAWNSSFYKITLSLF